MDYADEYRNMFRGSNWGSEDRRAPTLQDGDTLLYSECGRILNHIDYRSHYFRIVARKYVGVVLLVKHGAGEEDCKLDYEREPKRIRQIFEPMDSDTRYLLMHMLYSVRSHAQRESREATAQTYRDAFASGRLRKRKYPNQDRVKVWIEGK